MPWSRLSALLRRPSVLALLLVGLSFCGFVAREFLRPYQPPFGGLHGWTYSDHYSHMNAARLLTVCGTCVWTKPVRDMYPALDAEQRQRVDPELRPYLPRLTEFFFVPGWAPDKQLLINWSHLPRPYPPGVYLLVAPVALAYHFTGMSFFEASRWLHVLFLLFAHAGLYVLLRGALEGRVRPAEIGLLGGVLVAVEFIRWAVEGFYDGVLLAPLVLCGFYLRERRGLAAVVAYCVAAFLHYRTFFLAPLVLYALYLIVKEKQWRQWRGHAWAGVALAGVLGGASLYTFWLVSPWLGRFPATNPLRWISGNGIALQVVLAGVLAAAAFLYARAWLDVALLGWFVLMVSRVVQTQPWHALALVAWLALPAWTALSQRTGLVRDARFITVWMLASGVYGDGLLPPYWMANL